MHICAVRSPIQIRKCLSRPAETAGALPCQQNRWVFRKRCWQHVFASVALFMVFGASSYTPLYTPCRGGQDFNAGVLVFFVFVIFVLFVLAV